jgi:Flp pilus assembly protein TadD
VSGANNEFNTEYSGEKMNPPQGFVQPQKDLRESLEEREDILFDELELAIKWDRPSILIAVYESEYTRKEIARKLESRLSGLRQEVLHFHIDEKLFDVPMILVQNPAHERTVYFITGLKWGGGKGGNNAYRALNMRREFFVDNQMRVVLWLTRSEAVHLPRQAPDFWAFRHRVIELMDPPSEAIHRTMNRQVSWDGWKSSDLLIDVDEKTSLRESMLADLPAGAESAASRSDLIYTLASYCWAEGEFDKSQKLLKEGLHLVSGMHDPITESQFWSGLGVVFHSQKMLKDAETAYQKAVDLNPYNTYAWNNLAILHNDRGENQKAIDVCKKSIEMKPKNTTAYSILGDVYRQLGLFEDSKECYQTATRLEPKVAQYWISLGDIQFEQQRDKEALRAFLKASRLNEEDPEIWKKIGKVYSRMNRSNDAEKVLRKALAINPDDPETASLLKSLENID